MNRTRRSLATAPWPAALLALAALVALAPGSARAGCATRGHAFERFRSLGLGALGELSGDIETPVDPGSDAAPPRRLPPCSGPSCSEGPGVPLAAPLAAPGPWRELWCRLTSPLPVDPRGRFLARIPGESPRPVSGATDVERPPRRPAA
ncbi:hypothetical protein [Paludisphaera soli]|uniref:hypothetical protein n=1 Tax=Paludisphaera soli TaxID=2712865 RepID=UPI0013EB87E5|nr:hypothetical protein [Paludisphaera soli]